MQKISRNLARFLSFVLVCATLPWAKAQAEGELRFGLISGESKEALIARWKPLLEDLSHRLGAPVEPVVYDDYSGMVWALAADKVHVAWMGNKSAIQAVDRAECEVGMQVLGVDGQPGYFASVIVRTDSPIRDEKDLFAAAPQLTFGYGDLQSTSGYLVPAYYLFARNQVDPARVFKRVVRGNHESNFLSVAQGRADAATNNNINLGLFKERFPNEYKTVKVIWQSPMVPSDPVVWRKSLAPERKAAVRDFLAAYGHPMAGKSATKLAEEKAVLAQMEWAGFRSSDNSQLQPIRQLELFAARAGIEANVALSAEERARKLAEIDEKLEKMKATGANSPR